MIRSHESEVAELVAEIESARENGELLTPTSVCAKYGKPELRQSVVDWLRSLDKFPDPAGPHPDEVAGNETGRFGRPLNRLGRFDVHEKLGHGGMGVVYRASNRESGDDIAIKFMRDTTSADLLRRFKREFRSLADLKHDNLVKMFDCGVWGDTWYYTMELIDGRDFMSYVTGPSRPDGVHLSRTGITRLRSSLEQLAGALNHIHTQGKLHLDIKPSNVLVAREPEGRIVVLDFGLSADTELTGKYFPFDVIGTFEYLAPEQVEKLLRGRDQGVSPATDWYGVGVMLFEALTGRLPFEPRNLDARCNEDPPDPRAFTAHVPHDLADLSRRLLSRNPADRPRGEEVAMLVSKPQSRPVVSISSPDGIVGRTREIETLRSAFRSMQQGNTTVCAVHGESGVGKTVLVDHFLDEFADRDDVVVLRGRCYQQEAMPFKALDGLIDSLCRYLRRLSRQRSGANMESVLPTDMNALLRVFKVLRAVEALNQAPERRPAADVQEQRRRAAAALRELFTRLGGRLLGPERQGGLILAIDDLQWGDRDSARFLSDVLRAQRSPEDRESPELLLILSYRSENPESSPFLTTFLEQRQSGIDWHEVSVEPLLPQDRLRLIQKLIGPGRGVDPELLEEIGRQSLGHPLFIRELVQQAVDRSSAHTRRIPRIADSGARRPMTLRGVVQQRVERLTDDSRSLLEIIAVAGRPIRLDAACDAADLERGVDHRLTELQDGGFIRIVGDVEHRRLDTFHDVIREAVSDRLSQKRLQHDHLQIASALEKSDCAPEVLATHLRNGGELARAGHYFERSAELAAEALAFERAIAHYREALALQELTAERERQLRIRLADACVADGRGAEAAGEYLIASEGAEQFDAIDLKRRAALQFLSSGHCAPGERTLRDVVKSVGIRMPGSTAGVLSSLLWLRCRLRWRSLEVPLRDVREIPRAELDALDVCQTASFGLSLINSIQAAAFQTRSLLMALRAGEPRRLTLALGMEGVQQAIAGSKTGPRAHQLLRACEDLAFATDDDYLKAMARLGRGAAEALAGNWQTAQTLCDDANTRLRDNRVRNGHPGVMWELGTSQRFALWPLMFMGEFAEIAKRLPGLIDEARDRDDLYGVTNLYLVIRTFVMLAADEPERARRELDELMARWARTGFHVQHMEYLYDQTQIDLYSGDAMSAWDRLNAQWPLLKRSLFLKVQQVRVYMYQLRARAALAAAVSSPRQHQWRFLKSAERDARRLWREKAAWAQALAQLVHAGVASVRGNHEGAASLFGDGAERCEATDMKLYAACARRRLGELRAGAERQQSLTAAEPWFRRQDIVNPDRMTDLLVPASGFSE